MRRAPPNATICAAPRTLYRGCLVPHGVSHACDTRRAHEAISKPRTSALCASDKTTKRPSSCTQNKSSFGDSSAASTDRARPTIARCGERKPPQFLGAEFHRVRVRIRKVRAQTRDALSSLRGTSRCGESNRPALLQTSTRSARCAAHTVCDTGHSTKRPLQCNATRHRCSYLFESKCNLFDAVDAYVVAGILRLPLLHS